MSDEKNRIMTHLVAGYPGKGKDLEIAVTLAENGASALEIQFPFSDPTADGPAIEKACTVSLARGFRVSDGFELVRNASKRTGVPVFIMTYASIVYAKGIKNFVREAAASGAEGLIIPDLPFDYDEGLYGICRDEGIECVPVIVPSMETERINKILDLGTAYIYAALRSGTTGDKTDINEQSISFLEKLGKGSAAIMAGFGIRAREQIEKLKGYADYLIVGSALVNIIAGSEETGIEEDKKAMPEKAGSYVRSLL